jgi:transcriptional regulator with XRE-family HTH domain
MGRNSRAGRRTPRQAAADRRSAEVAGRLGRMLKDARRTAGMRQVDAASIAGLAQTTWSRLETGADGRFTLATWSRAAMAVGSDMDAYLKRTSAASQPRDAVHLRHQELVIRTALGGGWRALPEQQLDADARTSRAADVLLRRGREYALIEVWDWLSDVGGALRDFDRRLSALERYAIARMTDDAPPTTGGCWVMRATVRNRQLVAEHRHLFSSRFPGLSSGWLDALTEGGVMPEQSAILWASAGGERLFPARLARARR